MTVTLVFPSSVPAGKFYISQALARGESVLAASSLSGPVFDEEAGIWEFLPSIHDPSFLEAFRDLIDNHSISRAYSPVTLVYCFLRDLIARERLALSFVSAAPFYQAIEAAHVEMARAVGIEGFVRGCADGAQVPNAAQIGAILQAAFGIFGESYEDKIAAMIGVLSTVPAGDIVEIGGLFGRSASVAATTLGILGRHNPILVVDPWDPTEAVQKSLSPSLRRAALDADWDGVVSAFDMNLAPFAGQGRFNRLRATSAKGFSQYREAMTIHSSVFGETRYTGRIALLHIDGNHDYDSVRHDQETWGARVIDGGWIIHDDYRWTHGDGPLRVADSVLSTSGKEIARAFVAGGALFMQWAAR